MILGGHGTSKISEEKFDQLLAQSEQEFKDEIIWWMALLKVRDTEIFKQTMNEL